MNTWDQHVNFRSHFFILLDLNKFFFEMESAPTIEETCSAIATLYYNPDRGEKEKASVWLQDFQKSVHAWKVWLLTTCARLETFAKHFVFQHSFI